MTGIDDHRARLRAELVAAAARRAEGADAGSPRGRRLAPLLAAASVVLALTVGAVVATSRPASADAFRVVVEDEFVLVTVEDLIEDPADAADELREAGLEATLVARPAAPSLEGVVVATTSTSGPIHSEGEDGRITSFRLPRDELGPFTIEYGRAAEPGEVYGATEVVPDCDEYFGKPLTEDVIADIAERWGPEIEWQELDGGSAGRVPQHELDHDASIVMILPLSPDSVLVRVANGPPPPSGDGC